MCAAFVQVGDTCQVSFGSSIATPAIADDRIYVRTLDKLYCFSEKSTGLSNPVRERVFMTRTSPVIVAAVTLLLFLPSYLAADQVRLVVGKDAPDLERFAAHELAS